MDVALDANEDQFNVLNDVLQADKGVINNNDNDIDMNNLRSNELQLNCIWAIDEWAICDVDDNDIGMCFLRVTIPCCDLSTTIGVC